MIMTILIDFVISICVLDIGYAWWIFIRFYVEKRMKCEFLFID